MHSRSVLLGVTAGVSAFAGSASAAYTLQDNYATSSFFSQFSFFTGADPTHGYVDYVSEGTAESEGLVQTNSQSVYIGVDHNNTASGSGRQSVRLTSSKSYDTGLFVLDAAHMPTGCGTWPAFWLVGPDWPNNGEIDIIEGVNAANTNQATLHTASGCSISSSASMSGKVLGETCAVTDGSNTGCGITDEATNSYGAGFNSAQGGVYATEVTASQISIWFFPRGKIPSDLSGDSPDPSGWGEPFALFSGCDVSSYFKDMQIVFDTTFCGDWAGAVFSSDPTCSAKGSSCTAFVQDNPEDFAQAYWTVNSLKVFSGSASGETGNSTTGSNTVSGAGAGPTATQKGGSSPSGTKRPGKTATASINPGGPVKSATGSVNPGGPIESTTLATATAPASSGAWPTAWPSAGGPWNVAVNPSGGPLQEVPAAAQTPSPQNENAHSGRMQQKGANANSN